LSILDAMADAALFGPLFRPPSSWTAWRAFLAGLFGLPLSPSALATFQRHTGRQTPPEQPAREGWVVVGRRGGKSRIAALVAVYLAAFRDYTSLLAPGEKATVMLIAADRKQARVLMRYIVGMLDAVPMLRQLVTNRTADSVELSNRVVIEIHTASFRSVRGYSIVAAICDEIAYWRSEDSANPDTEILNAIRPAMATTNGLLLCISSPYARRGALWTAFRDHHGHENDSVLVWQAASRDMNATIPAHIIADAYRDDPSAANAEWGGQFRADLESFVDVELLASLVESGVRERGHVHSLQYVAFCDPSGGSGSDSMTLAIAHVDPTSGHAVLDCIAEQRPPFSPDECAKDFAAILARYGVRAVVGDRYGGDWPLAAFKACGIRYRTEGFRDPSDTSSFVALSKSDIYRELLPLLNGGHADLLDEPRLLRQLSSLERRTGSSGRDTIDHGSGQHDDLANAACGALLLAARSAGRTSPFASAAGAIIPPHLRAGSLAPLGPRGQHVTRPAAGRIGGQAARLSRYY
jgi:hypothetical protein